MSIWDLTNRATFEHDVAALYKTTTSNSHRLTHLPHSLSEPISRPTLSNTSLPADIESQLASDFAFLAAWENTPSCVAAATVKQSDESGGIRVSIAANEGIVKPVEEFFRSITTCMERCASCCLSRDACTRHLLDITTRLHRNRIFERLGSPKARRFKPGEWPIRQSIVVSHRLRSWIQDLEHKARRQKSTDIVTTLLTQVRALHHAVILAEEAADVQEHDALQSLVRAAYDLTDDSQRKSLQARLNQIGFDDEFTKRKEFREIYAIANYERISFYMAKVARKYHRIFSSMSLSVAQSHKVEIWHGHKHFVHAEIQLLVQHELEPASLPARCIGTSKQACLLCYYFIRSHGVYTVPRTHGEVMPQWTVPESQKLPNHGRGNLQKVLNAVASDIKSSLKTSPLTKRGRAGVLPPFAAHSTRDLSFAPIMTPSALTLVLAQEDAGCKIIADAESPGTGEEEVVKTLPTSVSCSGADLTLPSTLQRTADSEVNRHDFPINDLIVSAGYPKVYVSDDLLLFLEMENDYDTNNVSSGCSSLDRSLVYKSATCSIRPVGSQDHIPVVKIDEIGSLEGITLQRGEGLEDLTFAIQGDSGQIMITTIRWLTKTIDTTSDDKSLI